MDKLQFLDACDKVIGKQREKRGVGTLSEKTLHAVLKRYYEPYEDNHEVKIGGFVADIVGENGIIEIQTASFSSLRKKLAAFLEVAHVTVVYPIPHIKWLCWLDEESGAVTSRRKSPKLGTGFEVLYELYWIREFLHNQGLTILVTLIDIEEYRRLDGWGKDKKNRASRYDRIPIDIFEEIEINNVSDYRSVIPTNLSKEFTVKELCGITKAGKRKTSMAISVLKELGIIEKVGMNGREYLYSVAAEKI